MNMMQYAIARVARQLVTEGEQRPLRKNETELLHVVQERVDHYEGQEMPKVKP